MNRDRWTEVKPLLDRALDLRPAERRGFVDARCADDLELKQELQSYLELESDVDTLFEEPILDLIAGRPPEYRTGQRIGAFELEDELARGGMGVVYRAKRIEGGFRQDVAIKVLKRGFDTGDFVRGFRAEQQILANLDHPYIARLIDGGATEDGLPYLVMERVDGLRLDHYCLENRCDLPARLALFAKICEAVHAAHQRMVIHCDLKPSNILVTEEGEPKLLDFGIAKVMRQDRDSATRSLSIRLGTPPFASPEQVEGGEITTSADVYGLGAILFLLLTGRKPERPAKVEGALQLPSRALAHALGEGGGDRGIPYPPQALEGDLDAIVIAAMAHDKEERYASVAALGQDLERHLQNLPVSAQPYTWTYALRLLTRRRSRELWALAATVLLVLLINVAWLQVEREMDAIRAEEMIDTSLEMLEVFDSTADESKAQAAKTVFTNLSQTETLTAASRQDVVYDRLGRYLLRNGEVEEARPFLERALELRRGAGTAVTVDEADSLNNLGVQFRQANDLEGAAAFYGRALELYQQHPQWDDAEELDILHNLAIVEGLMGDTQAAGQRFLEALERRREHYGKKSREVARTLNALGSFLIRTQQLEAAAPRLEENLAIREEIYGPDHANVALALLSLAILREAQGDIEEAIGLFRRALDIRIRRYGEDATATAKARSALAFGLLGRATLEGASDRESDLAEARALLEQARDSLSLDTASTREAGLAARRNLAAVLLELRQLEAARQILVEVDGESDSWSPANSWRIADVRNLLGAVLTAQGKPEEAASLMQGTVERIEAARGPDSRYAREATERVRDWEAVREGLEVDPR